jgi:tetratricopeptide (TPR) repeat protein
LQEYAQKTDDLTQADNALTAMVSSEKQFALTPDDDTAKFIALGDRLVKAGRSQDAMSVYTKAWQLQPATPDSHAEDARLLTELNRDQIPLSVIDSKKDHNEVLIKAETNLLQYISLCQLMAGDPGKESPYQDSLANTYNTLGWLYFREKRFDEELAAFKHPLELNAVKTDPIKLGFRTYLAALGYSHTERNAEAAEWFKRAEAEGKASSDKCLEAVCCAFLARLSATKSDFTEARTYISKALRLMQSNPTFYPNEEMLPAQVFRECARAYGVMHDIPAKEATYKQGIAFLDAHKLQADNQSWVNLMDLYAKLLRSLPGRDSDAAQLENRLKAIRDRSL